MNNRDPRVDAYIEHAADFARPILVHLREVVHAGCPQVVEDIKWGTPHFLHHGMLASMAAFKAHASFGFWRGTELLPGGGEPGAMGQFGRIATLRDLPAKKTLVALVKQAAALNEAGASRVARPARAPKPEAKPSPAFAAALAADRKAAAAFAGFSPSARREYVAWIEEAKREETRARRIAQAVEWIAQGRPRNWKYAGC